MSDQIVTTLVSTALVLLLPSALGALVALRGDGRYLGIAAAAALALGLVGLSSLTAGREVGVSDYGPNGLGDILFGYLTSFIGLVVGIAACAVALARSLRTGRLAWFAALLAAAALPLLATVAVFDYTVLVTMGPLREGQQSTSFQGERLAFALLPIGPAALLVYGIWLALAAQRARRVWQAGS